MLDGDIHDRKTKIAAWAYDVSKVAFGVAFGYVLVMFTFRLSVFVFMSFNWTLEELVK